jgi:hypothetical protein
MFLSFLFALSSRRSSIRDPNETNLSAHLEETECFDRGNDDCALVFKRDISCMITESKRTSTGRVRRIELLAAMSTDNS